MLYDPRVPYPRAYFSASDLASARYGEARFLGDVFVNVFAIACACNEQVCSGGVLPELRLEDVPIKAVETSIPSVQQYKLHNITLKRNDIESEQPLYQPCLLVEKGKELELLDGSERLAAQKAAGVLTIRCFVIPHRKAIKFGRALIDDSPIPSAGWRTFHGTMPPQMDGQINAPGAVLSDAHRGLLAEQDLRLHRYQSSLLAFAATAAGTENGKVVADLNLRSLFTSEVRLKEIDQGEFDVIFRDGSDKFRTRGPAMSLYEILSTLYIKRLIAGILLRNGVAGKAILIDEGLSDWPGAPANIHDWLKYRSDIEANNCDFFSRPIDGRLLEAGMLWQNGEIDDPIAHCVELSKAAFKVYGLAVVQRGNLRRLLELNTRQARQSHYWPEFFKTAVDGSPDPSKARRFSVGSHERALLALHGRINPAKIWRDDTRNTLLYQWIIALGDLVRTGKMIVTCLMAQELFQVEDLRSVATNPKIAPAWSLFDEILALATAAKVCRLNPLSELNLLCRDAMRDRSAQIISLSDDAGKHFGSRKLGPATIKPEEQPTKGNIRRRLSPSEIAELPILLI